MADLCKHRRLVDGHKCGYRKQWSEEKINNAVEEAGMLFTEMALPENW